MIMHPHQSQGMGQMVMRPQQFQCFAQQMIQPPLSQGNAPAMMDAQKSYSFPQLINSPQQTFAPSPATMGGHQTVYQQGPVMHAQQAAGGLMSHAEILSFAHSTMSSMQFLAFAQALTMPAGHATAMTSQPPQDPVPPVQSPISGGGHTPAIATELFQQTSPNMCVKSNLSSPGSFTKVLSTSPAFESLNQVYMPSTPTMAPQPHTSSSPTMPKAQEAINTAVLMTPQHSQGPTGGMASSQQSQEYPQGMELLLQPQGFGQTSPPLPQTFKQASTQQVHRFDQDMPASQQFAAYSHAVSSLQQQFSAPTLQPVPNEHSPVILQSSIDDQHASPTAIDQAPMIDQGIQHLTILPTPDLANGSVVMPKQFTPYRGIVPPAKRHSQSNQLGMLHKFVGSITLGPVVSTKTRVTKNTLVKTASIPPAKSAAIEASVCQIENYGTESGVTPQLPVSPISPVEQADDDIFKFIVFDDKEDDSANESANIAITGMDGIHHHGVAPEMQAEFDLIRAEVNALFEDPDDVQENSAALPKANALSLPDTKNNTMEKSMLEDVDDTVELPNETTNYYQPNVSMTDPMEEVLAFHMHHYLDALEAERAVTNVTATEGASAEDISDDVELVDDPNMRIATPEEIDRMTLIEQYCYGIRQGLPNKGYPMKSTPQNASL